MIEALVADSFDWTSYYGLVGAVSQTNYVDTAISTLQTWWSVITESVAEAKTILIQERVPE
jgi:hypothetical protein